MTVVVNVVTARNNLTREIKISRNVSSVVLVARGSSIYDVTQFFGHRSQRQDFVLDLLCGLCGPFFKNSTKNIVDRNRS